jgi:hypothetical protein
MLKPFFLWPLRSSHQEPAIHTSGVSGLQTAVEVKLPGPEAVQCHIMTKSLKLAPNSRIMFFHPLLGLTLVFDINSCIKPIAQPVISISKVRQIISRRRDTHMYKSGLKPYSSSADSINCTASSYKCWRWLRDKR